ncbi:hypothetical protein HY635_00360 [Candidatus Uhrbacteria bacterium]|nr:hypothetical protein [Candidatus Uhrbacteria bacterium]
MEAKTKPKDPNDPREYLPVPRGASKLLTLFTVIAVITGSVGWYLYRSVGTSEADTVLSGILCTMWLIILVHFVISTGIPILNDYWLRNVRGYRIACWLGCGPTGRPGEVLCHKVIAPGSALKGDEVTAITLILPLGGWFRKPATIVAPENHGHPWLWGSAQLRLRYPLGSLQSLDDIGGRSIRITDPIGDRVTVTVREALALFEQHGVNMFTRPISGWPEILQHLQNRSAELTRERDHEQEAHRHARYMWTTALIAMEQTILEIAKTSRFVGSVEALRIRLFLLEHFRELVPTPDPKEPQRAKWIGWADEELASARADLARRDRHKRRPSAGAGT